MRHFSFWICFFVIHATCRLNAHETRPNIILVMIDDCSAVELSCYATPSHPAGNQTPVIDGLAEDGLRFTTCWATPLCMPTRALLISGKYGCRTGVFGNRLYKPDSNFAKTHKPFSKVLQESGYDTAISGKWHLPGFAAEESYGWNQYSLLGGYMTPYKKDLVWDGLWFSWSNAADTFYDKAIIGKNDQRYPAIYWHGAVIENGDLLPSTPNTYAPDLCQKFSIEFIMKKREQPFFLYYPMVLPHDPWLGTPDPDHPGQRTEPGFSNLIRRTEYYVKELIECVKKADLYENTLIIFTADNATLGYGKNSCSELGVRVPLIVAGGPLKKTGTTNVLVDFADMYPTILECAGLDPESISDLDGKSFAPLLLGQTFHGKEMIFSFLDMQRTVRDRDYMMDGSGGIWRCSESGNILDYQAVSDVESASAIRSHFMEFVDQFPIPTAKRFGADRIERAASGGRWPSFLPSLTSAIKLRDEWMHQERRKKE